MDAMMEYDILGNAKESLKQILEGLKICAVNSSEKNALQAMTANFECIFEQIDKRMMTFEDIEADDSLKNEIELMRIGSSIELMRGLKKIIVSLYRVSKDEIFKKHMETAIHSIEHEQIRKLHANILEMYALPVNEHTLMLAERLL
jgi:hypothetical protein